MKTLARWTTLLLLLGPVLLTASDQEPLVTVPAELRASLRTRLALLERYEKGRCWSKVYRLVSKRNDSETEKAFVKRMERTPDGLVAFILSSSRKSGFDNDQWFLYGRILVKTPSGQKCYKGRVVADLNEGEWYFKPILESIIIPVDAKPLECRSD